MNIDYLYRKVIMEHYKNPLNKGLIDNKDYKLVNLNNPSCGDLVSVQVLIDNNIIKDIKHEGFGCSISLASTSVMSDTLINMKIDDANIVIKEFYKLVSGQEVDNNILKGDALAFSGVSEFPARIKCATLAWKAIEEALKDDK